MATAVTWATPSVKGSHQNSNDRIKALSGLSAASTNRQHRARGARSIQVRMQGFCEHGDEHYGCVRLAEFDSLRLVIGQQNRHVAL
jgi:hypothetical protein